MNARTSWSARSDRRSAADAEPEGGDQALNELLETRFDEEGKLSRGNRRRIAERLDPRPAEMNAEELERAVQKLALGLEAIERQGSASRSASARAPQLREDDSEGENEPGESRRDFVTHSLDRLEARLEALTRQLSQRNGAGDARSASRDTGEERQRTTSDQPFDPRTQARSAGADALAPAGRPDPVFAAEPLDRSEARHVLDRRAEAEEIAARKREEQTEARRLADAAEARRLADAAEARRQADVAEAGRAKRAEEAEMRTLRAAEEVAAQAARRSAEEAVARSEAATAELAEMRRQFASLDDRISALQQSLEGNQIEPVRRELVEVLRHVEDLGRGGQSVSGALDRLRDKLDDIESKVTAGDAATGGQLGALQERLADMTDRILDVEAEVPGFDAVRENQSAILERFDLMEGLVHRLASPEELLDKVEAVRRQLPSIASQREVARIEQQILGLADRLDAMPGDLDARPSLERMEGQLQTLAAELVEARRSRNSGAVELRDGLAELTSSLKDLSEQDHTPDLSEMEARLAEIASRLDSDRRVSGDSLARLDRTLTALATAVETHEDEAAAQALAALTRKVEGVAEAIGAQDAGGARRDIEALDRKLDQLNQALAEQAEHLSRPQLEPLESRLAHMQGQLEEISQRARTSTAQFGPFAQKLQEISERVSGLGDTGAEGSLAARLHAIEERLSQLPTRGPDLRALHTQLEGVVSRLELLKGRSIDPARLTDLFDRVDAAIRNGFADDRLERIERKIDEVGIPVERFDRLERKLADVARLGFVDERFDRLERQIEDSVGAGFDDERFERLAERLAENAGGGISAERLDLLSRKLAESARGMPLEQLDRIEAKLAAASRTGLPDERFAALERKLDEIGRTGAGGELLNQEDLADLRGDIVALRRELRSLPGLGEGEASLAAVLKKVSDRLERLSEDPPATAAELEAQIARIAEVMEDPGNNRLALAHIESSLKSIEERFEDARKSLASRPLIGGNGESPGDMGVVAGLARALSDDVSVLRNATESSERKTKDALEAVQGTLEAVVKRMAFLERDAEAVVASVEERQPEQADGAAVAVMPAAPARAVEPVGTDTIPEKPQDAPPESPSGGLFSRFTSSQLLRRATGGRTESFSPEPDDAEEGGDLPLEPGTNAPLDSALTGAPSSDTALMSGTRRKGSAIVARGAGLQPTPPRHLASEPMDGEDFLAAARRAAQAAAAETAAEYGAGESGASGRGGITGLLKRRRGAVLASLLAVAIALAAVQVVRDRMARDGADVATLAPVPASTSEPATPELALNTAPAEPVPAKVPAVPVATAAGDTQGGATPASASSDVQPVPVAAGQSEASAGTGEIAPATPQPPIEQTASLESGTGAATTSAQETEPAVPAAAAPTAATPPLNSAPAAAAPAAPAPVAAGLPAAIGPERLRTEAATNPVAAFEVASRYAEGRGSAQDLSAAIAWYTRAAEAGLAPAQYRLGSIYEKGIGAPKDLARAQDWYRRAAEAGNVKAMHNLAVLYAEGAGGSPDLEHAAQLFRQAAEHGVRDSEFNLAILHARGLGVPQDLVQAYKWFAVAAGSGDPESSKRRDIIGAALSEGDLAKAKAEAAAFQPQPLISEANDVTMPEGGWGDEKTGVLQSENDRIALVQKLLAEKGYNPGPADGLLGNQTIQAIATFQEKSGLPKTGQIDADLVAALQNRST